MVSLHSTSEQPFESAASPAQQARGGFHGPHGAPECFGLVVEYLETGRTSFLTFETEFDRGLFVIALGSQAVALRPVTYRNA